VPTSHRPGSRQASIRSSAIGIGIDFASFYADLGVEVTIVEVLDRVLPEDADVSDFMAKALAPHSTSKGPRGVARRSAGRRGAALSGDAGDDGNHPSCPPRAC
jgi:pyruvate/2-oxoglutarate dehydrogenase complex dihydrolipoamide dehydrogenase (E3) component